jgi:hypothetical protein
MVISNIIIIIVLCSIQYSIVYYSIHVSIDVLLFCVPVLFYSVMLFILTVRRGFCGVRTCAYFACVAVLRLLLASTRTDV